MEEVLKNTQEDKSVKLVKAYASVIKTEEIDWAAKFHSFQRQLAYADRWYSRGKYKRILKELKAAEEIHNTYCKGLKAVVDILAEII